MKTQLRAQEESVVTVYDFDGTGNLTQLTHSAITEFRREFYKESIPLNRLPGENYRTILLSMESLDKEYFMHYKFKITILKEEEYGY